jgi:excisionase family DNA binding protein
MNLPEKPWLRVREVAEYFDVHVNTIKYWIRLGRLDAVKLSKQVVRIPRESVLKIRYRKKITDGDK